MIHAFICTLYVILLFILQILIIHLLLFIFKYEQIIQTYILQEINFSFISVVVLMKSVEFLTAEAYMEF